MVRGKQGMHVGLTKESKPERNHIANSGREVGVAELARTATKLKRLEFASQSQFHPFLQWSKKGIFTENREDIPKV